MKKCSHRVMQGRLEAIKANSGAQVICREKGRRGGGEGLYRGPAERHENTQLPCHLALLGLEQRNLGLLCADPKDKVAKLFSLEATPGHVIVELGQRAVV